MKNIKSSSIMLIAIIILVTSFFTLGVASSKYIVKAYGELYGEARRIKRDVDISINPASAYVEDVIKQQAAGISNIAPENAALESALLPLIINKTKINRIENVSEAGGAISFVGNELLLMDRLGVFYRKINDGFVKIDIPTIPNNLVEYVKNSKNLDLNINTLRTHSLAYDEKTNLLYASFERYINPVANRLTVASIDLTKDLKSDSGKWNIIFETENLNPISNIGIGGGGKILINEDSIILAIGDFADTEAYFNAKKYLPQDLNSNFGKIITINKTNQKSQIISIGHRNTQGLTYTNEGKIINVEQGPQGGDELNVIEVGKNYGWPFQTYGTHYGTYTWPLDKLKNTIKWQKPLFAFTPSVAASSIIQINKFNDRWDNDLLVGSLKAKSLFRLKYEEGRVIYSEPIWIGHRIRDLIQKDNVIYAITDDMYLLRISVDYDKATKNLRSSDIPPSKNLEKCLKCHNFGVTTPNSFAPSLSKIIGRKAGSDNFEHYSDALKNSNMVWNERNIEEFLKNTQALVPGTTMPLQNLSHEEARALSKELSTR
jgi:glucose/arabinose dehydrogenase/cytochrome c2